MGFRRARKKAGIKLKDAAEFFGVSKQALNAWERGAYDPKNTVLVKMAALYGCTVDELLAPDEDSA